jgi:drug/metabolite transporter (DMT)-like permease
VISGTLAILTTRKLKGTPTVVMMFFYTARLMLLSAPLALLGWIPMAPEHVLPLLAIGAFAQSGQYCFLRAHWLGDTSVLGLLGYLSLPLSGLVGYLFFTEIPTAHTLIGATIILLALTQVGPR